VDRNWSCVALFYSRVYKISQNLRKTVLHYSTQNSSQTFGVQSSVLAQAGRNDRTLRARTCAYSSQVRLVRHPDLVQAHWAHHSRSMRCTMCIQLNYPDDNSASAACTDLLRQQLLSCICVLLFSAMHI